MVRELSRMAGHSLASMADRIGVTVADGACRSASWVLIYDPVPVGTRSRSCGAGLLEVPHGRPPEVVEERPGHAGAAQLRPTPCGSPHGRPLWEDQRGEGAVSPLDVGYSRGPSSLNERRQLADQGEEAGLSGLRALRRSRDSP